MLLKHIHLSVCSAQQFSHIAKEVAPIFFIRYRITKMNAVHPYWQWRHYTNIVVVVVVFIQKHKASRLCYRLSQVTVKYINTFFLMYLFYISVILHCTSSSRYEYELYPLGPIHLHVFYFYF